MSSRINVGKVCPIPKGNWTSTTTYEKLNMVNKGGVLYIAKDNVEANTAIENTNKWMQATGKTLVGNVETVSYTTGASVTTTTSVDGNTILNFRLPRGISGNDDLDDTAGSGDTDKVWSADKVDREIKKNVREGNEGVVHHAEGTIASFEDGANDIPVKDLKISIEPVQDLHGYDNPWPAGGGKNLFDENGTYQANTTINNQGEIVSDTTSGLNPKLYDQHVPVSASTQYTISSKSATALFIRVVEYTSNGTFIKRNLTTQAINPSATFTTDSTASYVIISPDETVSSIQLEQGSIATSYAPYSNICPITGFTQAKITRTGKNLLRNDTVTYPYSKNGVTLTKNQDGSISISGSNSGSEILLSIYRLDNKLLNALNGKAICYGGNHQVENAEMCITYYKSDGTWLGGQRDTKPFVISKHNEAYFANVQIRIVTNANDINGITLYPQIELGQTATAYEPYNGTSFTIDLNGTRYGGTIDVLAGEMTVDREIVDLGSLTWNYNTSWNGAGAFYLPTAIPVKLDHLASETVKGSICSMYPQVSRNALYNGTTLTAYCIPTDGKVSIRDTRYSDATVFQSAMNGIKLVYPLAQPVTVQLTPAMLNTLFGTNNTWSDTGDTSVDYIIDTKTLFDKKADVIECTESGSLVSFTDGADDTPVSDLVIGIEPVQDLHGYDNPWPAGGGKNKWISGQYTKTNTDITYTPDGDKLKVNGTASGTRNYYFTADAVDISYGYKLPAGQYTYHAELLSGTASNVSGGLGFSVWYDSDPETRVVEQATVTTTDKTFTLTEDATIQPFVYFASGSVLTNAVYGFQLEQSSTKTDWTPYSNVCPISGYSNAVVMRTGKNLANIPDKTATGSGYIVGSGSNYYSNFPINLKSGVTYTISFDFSGTAEGQFVADSTNGGIVYSSKSIVTGKNFKSFTPTKDLNGFRVYSSNSNGGTYSNFQLEYSSTATAYKPYRGTSVTIDLGGTRYGGNLDITTGKLTVDKVFWTKNTSTMNNSEDYPGWSSAGIREYVEPNSSHNMTGAIGNIFGSVRDSPGRNFVAYNTMSTNDILYLPKSVWNKTQTEWIADAIDVQIVIPLYKPQIIWLDPKELITLKGNNTIFANTGDIESLTYRADTKLYIQKLTQPTEDDMIANDNIAANKFFMVGNTLYYSTQAISTGTTIVPGSNCTQLSLADALNQLNA